MVKVNKRTNISDSLYGIAYSNNNDKNNNKNIINAPT